jgi:hypothetical protein
MTKTGIVLVLIALGCVLPLIGLFRVVWRARRNLPKADRISVEEQMKEGQQTGLFPVEPITKAALATDAAPVLEWDKVRWDLCLVGGGILCGSIGSAWAVFL